MNRESKTAAGSLARTFIVDVEDRPGVLNRVVSLFRRRNYNIESLAVGRTERPGISRITLVVRADADTADRIEANLYKLVNVLQVNDITEAPSIVRELAFNKVRASHEQRGEVLRLCDILELLRTGAVAMVRGSDRELAEGRPGLDDSSDEVAA